MAKQQIIHLIRHAEAQHNKSRYNTSPQDNLEDTHLTPHGITQSQTIFARSFIQNLRSPKLVIVSPLRRCIQTALLALNPKFNEQLDLTLKGEQEFEGSLLTGEQIKEVVEGTQSSGKWIADPRCMEITTTPFKPNLPSDLATLEELYGEYVDFPAESFVGKDWLRRTGYYCSVYSDRERVQQCLRDFKDFLFSRKEDEIIVFTHAEVIRQMVNSWWFKSVRNAGGVTLSWKKRGGKMVLVPVELKGPNDEIVELNGVVFDMKSGVSSSKNSPVVSEKEERRVLKEKEEAEGDGQSTSESKIELEEKESQMRELKISLGSCKAECRDCDKRY
jgi:hypothetical protein